MESTGKPASKKQKRRGKSVPPFPFEFWLKVARLREQEGYQELMLSQVRLG